MQLLQPLVSYLSQATSWLCLGGTVAAQAQEIVHVHIAFTEALNYQEEHISYLEQNVMGTRTGARPAGNPAQEPLQTS